MLFRASTMELGASSWLTFQPIYLDNDGMFAVLDDEDAAWASQWKWKPLRSKGRKAKFYAVRSARIPSGVRGVRGRNVCIFLHKEICRRAYGVPPSTSHICADHKDGNSLNCRRGNLRWATVQENNENYNGFYALQIRMAFRFKQPKRLEFGEKR